MKMKTYKAQYMLFHGVSKGLGVDYNETKIIKPVIQAKSFEEASKQFYLAAFETTQRYLPQTNGEIASLLFDFSGDEKNLIEKVAQALQEITTQDAKIQTYKKQGSYKTGILIKIGFYEKLLIEEHGVENYAFIENLRDIIHPQLKIHKIKRKTNKQTCARNTQLGKPYDLSTHGGFRRRPFL